MSYVKHMKLVLSKLTAALCNRLPRAQLCPLCIRIAEAVRRYGRKGQLSRRRLCLRLLCR